MTTPAPKPATYTPLGRVAGSRFLKTKPMPFLDSSLPPRRRVKSFVWFLSGSWRGAAIRSVARVGLQTADQVIGKRRAG